MSRSTIFADLLIVINFAVVTFSLWAYFNRPIPENALSAAREEVLFMLALFAVFRYTTMNLPDAYLWVFMLLIQSVPYTASTLVALISGFPKMPAWLVGRSTSMEAAVQKILAGTQFGHSDGKTDNERNRVKGDK